MSDITALVQYLTQGADDEFGTYIRACSLYLVLPGHCGEPGLSRSIRADTKEHNVNK